MHFVPIAACIWAQAPQAAPSTPALTPFSPKSLKPSVCVQLAAPTKPSLGVSRQRLLEPSPPFFSQPLSAVPAAVAAFGLCGRAGFSRPFAAGSLPAALEALSKNVGDRRSCRWAPKLAFRLLWLSSSFGRTKLQLIRSARPCGCPQRWVPWRVDPPSKRLDLLGGKRPLESENCCLPATVLARHQDVAKMEPKPFHRSVALY